MIARSVGLGPRGFRSLLASLAVVIVPVAAVLAMPQVSGAATPLESATSTTVPSVDGLVTIVEDAVLGEVGCLVNTILSSPKPTC